MTIPPIVDMRSRPALLHPFYGGAPGTPSYDTVRWLNTRTGSHEPEHFARSLTLPGYLAEVSDAGISTAVVVGRDTPTVRTDNDVIADLVAQDPRLIGIGSVSPDDPRAVEEIGRAVGELGLHGINLEPAFLQPPRPVDDPSLRAIYGACEDLGTQVYLMSGPTASDLDNVRPAAVGRLAQQFPTLQIVCFHGFYPFVTEIIGVAFRHANVHLVADMYTFAPGGAPYLEAANGVLQDQFLFGTAYPFRAMRQSVEDFLASGISEAVLPKVLHDNAARLLQLPDAAAALPQQPTEEVTPSSPALVGSA